MKREVTHGLPPHSSGFNFPPSLPLGNMPLLNLVAANIASWFVELKMHSYMVPQLNMYAACPDIPSVTISIQNIA